MTDANKAEPAWRGGRAAGLFTLALGIALLLVPFGGAFLRAVGVAMLFSAVAEAAVAVASGRTREAVAAAILALSGVAAAAILLVNAGGPAPQAVRAVLVALVVRAVAAALASLAAQPSGKGWVLCRTMTELAIAASLLASTLAFVIATPLASLSAVFFGGSASVAGSLLGALLVLSFVGSGLSQILASRPHMEPDRA